MRTQRPGRAAPNSSRNQQQPDPKKAGASKGLKPHPLLNLLPPTTVDERTLRRARVRLYGQRDIIEAIDDVIIAGHEEYVALAAEGVEPRMTNLKTAPENLVEYVLRRNIPRELSGLDRGCIAVLAYQQIAKAAARERMTLGTKLPEGWEGQRWFEHAAHIVGTRPGCVRQLASIRAGDAAVFEAVRARRIKTLQDARALVADIKYDYGDDPLKPLKPIKNENAPADRQEALRRYEASGKNQPLKSIIHDMRREKRIKKLPPAVPKGKCWAVYAGRMEDEASKVADRSVDVVFADILYGLDQAPSMAREVARIAKRARKHKPSTTRLLGGHPRGDRRAWTTRRRSKPSLGRARERGLRAFSPSRSRRSSSRTRTASWWATPTQ